MIPRPHSVRPEQGHLSISDGGIRVREDAALPREGYVLDTTGDVAELRGGSAAGLHYGRQTLDRLATPGSPLAPGARDSSPAPGARDSSLVPRVRIEDAPRFEWRGVLLDVARHFMPVPDVLKFVDLLAFHRLNVLHLHLTDDQGWRFEVPGWPRLTSVGAWRDESMLGARVHERYDGRPHGGFYTTDDLRRIVAYAAQRHITVVPEVDMPGHMQAAIAAYPELGNGFRGGVRTAWGISTHVLNLEPATLDFCRQVLDHVCDVFDSPVIGIGGDECPADEWPGGRELQVAFTAEMAAHLDRRGRRLYGWDEILAGGAPPGAVVAAWRGEEPAEVAIRAGHQVVCCPDVRLYLDYRQSDDPGEPTPVGTLLTLEDVYRYEPPDSPLVLGAQANLWTEHMESLRRVEYMAFPRLCAFAEVVWGPKERDLADFLARLPEHLSRLDAMGVNYRPLSGPRPADARPDAPGNPRTLADRLAELHEMTADLRGPGDSGP
ncbi:putative beta-N-acetylhexosaminidase [Actinoplanes missouriensis 431]|uniref:beta-N-acetylhexosaminidase n=1 Tax=Actinoplanes missouriensis (strain ATCC 14538 / DSM 43046 / CBS 188.64 / JCM 3121 / NBRC 102363 / NCIMB 12654 / NRRL B-3342 / UNCC 431) TaxID=512565 RepID=I0HEN0_ACTM4|nr:beta-N-acetylhexosaminidase [Actinoplanes missouriensis]BAL91467.1 putative beta-N-acetylhexosaminidase [Actinoplanes missouriensis 431]